jgi:hypothetical protein
MYSWYEEWKDTTNPEFIAETSLQYKVLITSFAMLLTLFPTFSYNVIELTITDTIEHFQKIVLYFFRKMCSILRFR